jgi:hypothetical protein
MNHSWWKMCSDSRAKCSWDRYAARGSVRIISVVSGVVSIAISLYPDLWPDRGSVMATDPSYAVYHSIDPGRISLE